MEDYILAFDEINAFAAYSFQNLTEGHKNAKAVVDDMLSLLIQAFTLGIRDTSRMLSYPLTVDPDDLYEVVFYVIDGKTFEDRAMDHIESGDLHGLQTLLESEYHRVYNGAVESGATHYMVDTGGAVDKTWYTVGDDKVRETHEYLEGMTVGLNEDFYTFDGDHAPYPGGFSLASNNVNCRCVITVQRRA